MRKTVIEVCFRPLGRPPKAGEWGRLKNTLGGSFIHMSDGCELGYWDGFERTDVPVEVEVPDPVPEWIDALSIDINYGDCGRTDRLRRAQTMNVLIRAHVERAAKEAAERLVSWTPWDKDRVARQIAEELLR